MDITTTDYTVLIVDDDKDIRSALEIYLSQEGYQVKQATQGAEAVQSVEEGDVHLVLLDIMMPVMDGIQAAVRIRKKSNVPIVFLSAKAEDTDRILGLNMGGDDYIAKPFNPVELMARVRATLRRYGRLGDINAHTSATTQNTKDMESDQCKDANRTTCTNQVNKQPGLYQTGDLVLDDRQKMVMLAGDEVSLTALEYNILKLLMSHMGQVFSADQIYETVWNEPAFEVSRIVSVHLSRIREKIEVNPKEPYYLKVTYGLGYKIVQRQ